MGNHVVNMGNHVVNMGNHMGLPLRGDIMN